MDGFRFRVLAKDTKTNARVGEIRTPHGVIQTPAFVPVGTQGAVKSLTPDELSTLGVQLFFVNTYHTYLRPGLDVIKTFGGLHRFMGWDGPIITDSGGFQVFSLARSTFKGATFKGNIKQDQSEQKLQLVKISDDGVEFGSHWDGTKHFFTPEKAMEYQWMLGSDIHIAFDDCTPNGVTHEKARLSMNRTHRWAVRSKAANAKCQMINAKSKKGLTFSAEKVKPLENYYQALYGSVQGSVYEDLRKESAKFITSLDFDGIAIGGVSVGETKKEMVDVLDWVVPILPEEKPRHLLGVGEIDDIFALVARGIDTFDCVGPTRMARMGHVFVKNYPILKLSNYPIIKYKIDITKKIYSEDVNPIDPGCQCYTCQHFSRGYIHHLFRVRELLAYRLATIHNIHFINFLMKDIRQAIADGSLLAMKKQWL